MSWVIPKENHTLSDLLDNEAFNDNVYAFAQEIDGNLNEHNFDTDALLGAFSDGLGHPGYSMRAYHRTIGIPVDSPSVVDLPQTDSWKPVEGTDIQFRALGSQVMAWCSFQLLNTPFFNVSGMNFALELDGVVQNHTLLGTGDETNDLFQVVTLAAAGTTSTWDIGTGPGVVGQHYPLVCSGDMTVTPGVHTVRLVYRNLITTSGSTFQQVSNRETVVLALWT